MNNYIINLDKDIDRRNSITQQLIRIGITPYFFSAVNGKALSVEEKNKTTQMPTYLRDGEIGCALSHLNIYQHIIDNNIDYALIIEDDAVFSDTPPFEDITNFMNQHTSKPVVILLHDVCFKKYEKIIINDKFQLNRVMNGHLTHAYIINQCAAKEILKVQMPIKFEIDIWKYYVYLFGLKLYTISPSVAEQDEKLFPSSIGDREENTALRNKNYRIAYKNLSLRNKIKCLKRRIIKNLIK